MVRSARLSWDDAHTGDWDDSSPGAYRRWESDRTVTPADETAAWDADSDSETDSDPDAESDVDEIDESVESPREAELLEEQHARQPVVANESRGGQRHAGRHLAGADWMAAWDAPRRRQRETDSVSGSSLSTDAPSESGS